ncbi:radical SAM family heme chaperone HemW [Auritidibacter ignavus]|uniref:radical SAM family heme chaperone HemW n=1 Tax=Auritidibacter ignavus TaxID=678932 RepID=UPI0021042E67|nr:radical SAM family heme chaperone HemW [Auritidibacter ignavus]
MPHIDLQGYRVPDSPLFPADVGQRILESLTAGTPRTFSLYVHIPFCTVRCGYCDFNTYTATDFGPGASHDTYATTVLQELEMARERMDASGIPNRPIHTVYFGGGTPTLLPATDLVRIVEQARELFGIKPQAEITTEANPDTVTEDSIAELAEGGFTRLSLGMQSAVGHVLKVLDRSHTPANIPPAVTWAKQAGLEVSLDLIFGTPGESLADWQHSLEVAIEQAPEHLSAYGLIVEQGTKLAAQIRRGTYPDTDGDDQADKYVIAEELLGQAGYRWYEISNWAYDPEGTGVHRAEHNLAYWRNQDWWGAGPGAHSHLAGIRWWNAKHPLAYAQRLSSGVPAAVGMEQPDEAERHLENIMLGIRLSDGLAISELSPTEQEQIPELLRQGLLEPGAVKKGRLVPTLHGRLLGDAITRQLADI